MSHRETQLAERRARLLARSELLRGKVAANGEVLRHSVEGIDRGIHVARSLLSRPLLLTAAAAALLILRPTKAVKWIARGALVTSLVRKAIKSVDTHQPPDRFGP